MNIYYFVGLLIALNCLFASFEHKFVKSDSNH